MTHPRQRLIWTVKNLPELKGRSPGAQRDLVRSTGRGGQVQLIIGAVLCSLLAGPLFVGLFLVPWASGAWPLPLAMAMSTVVLLLVVAAIYQALLSGLRRALQIRLAQPAQERRLEACLECGYDLRGSNSDKCPECGAATVAPQR